MAYVDKITTMRRCVLIDKGGSVENIEWEGVNIEGDILLKQVGTNVVVVLTEDNLQSFHWENYLLIYQDKEKKTWEPRTECEWINDFIGGHWEVKEN